MGPLVDRTVAIDIFKLLKERKFPLAFSSVDPSSGEESLCLGHVYLIFDNLLAQVGQRVRIEGGPLFGLEGLLVVIRKSPRLVLSVDLLQRSVLVEIDRDWVDSSKVRPSSTVFEPETLNARIS
jgi:hypothetical protein